MSPDQRAKTAAVRVFGTLGGRLPRPLTKPARSYGQDPKVSPLAHHPGPQVRACSQLLGAYRYHIDRRNDPLKNNHLKWSKIDNLIDRCNFPTYGQLAKSNIALSQIKFRY